MQQSLGIPQTKSIIPKLKLLDIQVLQPPDNCFCFHVLPQIYRSFSVKGEANEGNEIRQHQEAGDSFVIYDSPNCRLVNARFRSCHRIGVPYLGIAGTRGDREG